MPVPQRVYITAHNPQVADRDLSHRFNPQVMQRIFIKRWQNGNCTIEGQHRLIPFESLLLTQLGEGEGDFVITTNTLLEDLAERVWVAADDEKKNTTLEKEARANDYRNYQLYGQKKGNKTIVRILREKNSARIPRYRGMKKSTVSSSNKMYLGIVAILYL